MLGWVVMGTALAGTFDLILTSQDAGFAFAAFFRSFHISGSRDTLHHLRQVHDRGAGSGFRSPESLVPAFVRLLLALAFRGRVENPRYHPRLA